ncbi:MAG: flagellar basal-body rod protein FlgF [Calditrichaeota bacterium]|nr:MAG: flagellar basal-body rod protein FlgF [Calditrichota bacterium]
MLKGLFINKSGMLAQQRRLDVAANNLANLNTIGFKRETVFFRKLLDAMAESDTVDANRTPGASHIDFRQGTLKETGNPLDVAIVGEGFFVVQAEEGELLTRNGNFQLDGEGRLVTLEGFPVATDGGEIQISGGRLTFSEKGEIMVDGQIVGRLKLVTVDDPQLLEQRGNTFFAQGKASISDLSAEKVNLRAGYLETSNVDPLQEMITMIEVNREYELGQKSIKSQDESLDKLINKAGRIS